MSLPPPDERVRQILAHVLLMGQNSYLSPEAFAEALLRRLTHEGYAIVPAGVAAAVRNIPKIFQPGLP